jgi:hypothetical protein
VAQRFCTLVVSASQHPNAATVSNKLLDHASTGVSMPAGSSDHQYVGLKPIGRI